MFRMGLVFLLAVLAPRGVFASIAELDLIGDPNIAALINLEKSSIKPAAIHANTPKTMSFPVTALLGKNLEMGALIKEVDGKGERAFENPIVGEDAIQSIYVKPNKIVLRKGEKLNLQVFAKYEKGEDRLLPFINLRIYSRNSKVIVVDPVEISTEATEEGASEIVVTAFSKFVQFIPALVKAQDSEDEIIDEKAFDDQADKEPENKEVFDENNFPVSRMKRTQVGGILVDQYAVDAFGRARGLKNVRVSLIGTDYVATTDENGFFMFESLPVQSTFELDIIDFSGKYMRVRRKITVTENMALLKFKLIDVTYSDLHAKILNLDIEAKYGLVCGKVLDEKGEAVEGAEVYSSIGEKPIYFNSFGFPNQNQGATEANGSFCFFNHDIGLVVFSAYSENRLIGSMAKNILEGIRYDFEIRETLKTEISLQLSLENGKEAALNSISGEVVGSADYVISNGAGTFRIREVPNDKIVSVIVEDPEFENTIFTFNREITEMMKYAVRVPMHFSGFIDQMGMVNAELEDLLEGGVMKVQINDFNLNEDLVVQISSLDPHADLEGQDLEPFYFVKAPDANDVMSYLVTKNIGDSSFTKEAIFFGLEEGEYNVSLKYGNNLVGNKIVKVLEKSISPVRFEPMDVIE